MAKAQRIAQIKQDMADFGISAQQIIQKSGYSYSWFYAVLRGKSTGYFSLAVIRNALDQLIAEPQQKTIVWGEFDDGTDDGTDDRDLFCAGAPKNLAVLMTGGAA